MGEQPVVRFGEVADRLVGRDPPAFREVLDFPAPEPHRPPAHNPTSIKFGVKTALWPVLGRHCLIPSPGLIMAWHAEPPRAKHLALPRAGGERDD